MADQMMPPEQKSVWPMRVALVVGAMAVVVGAAAGGYFFAQQKNNIEKQVSIYTPVYPTPTYIPVQEPTPSTTPTTTSDFEVLEQPTTTIFSLATTSLPQALAGKIKWSQPKEIAELGLFKKNSEFVPRYFEVGSFNYEGQLGKVIILQLPLELGGPDPMYLLDYKKQFVLLGKYPWRNVDQSFYSDPAEILKYYANSFAAEVLPLLRIDYNFRIPVLEFPKVLKGPKERQVLTWSSTYPLPGGWGLGGRVVTNETVAFTDSQFGKVYTSAVTGGFYLYGPDGSRAIYALQPDFFNKNNNLAQIIWNDSSWNGYEYMYTDQGGCGATNFISIVTSTDVTLKNDLKAVGKTSKGDLVYELKDENHRLLTQFYSNAYFPTETGGKISYEQFVTLKPIIFWVDPFGRLIKMQNKRFITPAECGKPVIYLYPEKTTNVSVQVEPKGGMTVSDPFYNGGWQVQAQPDGQLTELKSGKQYPYLFWEGTGDLYQTPEQGFIIERKDLAEELPKKLFQLGLNTQETKDFMEFWQPLMQAKPYYFVTFLGTQQMNQLAPLTVSPKPDTVVRILMDFTPLDVPKVVVPLNLGRTPERKGFTVIEWGGVIRK